MNISCEKERADGVTATEKIRHQKTVTKEKNAYSGQLILLILTKE
jgi:hypothetical protein